MLFNSYIHVSENTKMSLRLFLGNITFKSNKNCLRPMWRRGTKCDCKTVWLWVRSPLEEVKYLLKFIFPFLHSGVEDKRGVEFCHSTRNAI